MFKSESAIKMSQQHFLARECLGWGSLLWLFGYALGFVFFPLAPMNLIGWYVMPIGLAFTALVLWKWVRADTLAAGLVIGVTWCVIAVILDYVFIVKLLNPPDGYYKLDVYLYYASAFLMPVLAAALRRKFGAT
jgi:uncharacterized membrane protein (DUF485 family)